MNDVGTRSFQGCSCEEGGIGFICESADEVDFDCPDDGFFPSAPCSDLWYNCWGGHATPEYCRTISSSIRRRSTATSPKTIPIVEPPLAATLSSKKEIIKQHSLDNFSNNFLRVEA